MIIISVLGSLIVEEDGFLTKIGLGEEQGKKMREKPNSLKQLVLEASAPNGSAIKDFQTLVGLIFPSFKIN